jgi:hypothetical protein
VTLCNRIWLGRTAKGQRSLVLLDLSVAGRWPPDGPPRREWSCFTMIFTTKIAGIFGKQTMGRCLSLHIAIEEDVACVLVLSFRINPSAMSGMRSISKAT